MTFTGLLLRLALGYIGGLLLGPLLWPRSYKLGDVSIAAAIAGALGATVPFALFNSIWSLQWSRALVANELWISAGWLCAPAIACSLYGRIFNWPANLSLLEVSGALAFIGLFMSLAAVSRRLPPKHPITTRSR